MSIPTTDRPAAPATPPTPRVPRALVAGATVLNRRAGLEWLRSRYGSVFTVDIPVFGSTVVVADPLLARDVFRAPTDVLESVEQNLGRVLGPNSMFALTGERHRRERKLLAPPFHGRRLRAYADVIAASARAEMATWPTDREFATMPSFMRITLDVIITAVFGAQGPEFDRLRIVLPRMVELGSMLAVVPLPKLPALGDVSPWGRLRRWRREYDAIVGRLIAAAQAADDLDERDDVLSMMVASRYDDGSPMTRDEIADELLTMLAAGHETTATTLAWAVERISRHPALLERLKAERDAGESALLDATILEVQRTGDRRDVPRRRRHRGAARRLDRPPRPVGHGRDRADPLRPVRVARPRAFRPRPVPRRPTGSHRVDPVRRRGPALHRCRVRVDGTPGRPADAARRRRRGADLASGGAVAAPRCRLRPGARRSGAGEQAAQPLTQAIPQTLRRRGR